MRMGAIISVFVLFGALVLGFVVESRAPSGEASAARHEMSRGAESHLSQQEAATGSGTAGQIPLWTSASTLGDSLITQSSGNVGIGNGGPRAKLDVITANDNWPALMVQNTGGYELIRGNDSSGNRVFTVANNGDVYVRGQRLGEGSTGPQGERGLPGPAGEQGPQGLPGPPVSTSAVCGESTTFFTSAAAACASVCGGSSKVVANLMGRTCRVTADTGSCSIDGFSRGLCCVCKP